MTEKKAKLNELDLPKETVDAMPLHLRSVLHEEIRQLRRIPEAPENIVKGSWI